MLMVAANFIVTFSGPPPFPAPVQASHAVDVAVTGRRSGTDKFLYRVSKTPPVIEAGQLLDAEASRAIARDLGISPRYVKLFREVDEQPPRNADRIRELRGAFSLGIYRSDGWHIVSASPRPWFTSWHRNVLLLTIAIGALLSLLAFIFARAITKPLENLVSKADASTIDGPPIASDPGAPPEISALANSLENMRARHAAAVASRTDLLVGIAHDLGTPLTRLSFRVEQLPPAAHISAIQDIEQMRTLIGAAMDFARGSGDARELVELDALVREVVARLDHQDRPVRLVGCVPVEMIGNEMALSRMVGNLVENAQRYAGNADVELRTNGATALISVADDGPGFEPEIVERLFEPFFRAESSRNLDTGGTGLGLAVARSIAEKHGGSISAQNRSVCGAEFVITLPVS